MLHRLTTRKGDAVKEVGPVCGCHLLGDVLHSARRTYEGVRRRVPAIGATEIAALEVDDGPHAGSVHPAVGDKPMDQHRWPTVRRNATRKPWSWRFASHIFMKLSRSRVCRGW